MTVQRAFVPAAGHDRWLKFYDPLTKLLGAPAVRRSLIEQAGIRSGQRVLDIGCGTGSLAIMLKRDKPSVEVVGLDPDPNALEIARRKAAQDGAPIDFVQGFADAVDRPSGTFDRVLSSLMLHHLTAEDRRATLAEVFRVLKPNGEFHVVDFTVTERNPRGAIARLLHHDDDLGNNAEARLPSMLTGVGFVSVEEVRVQRTLFGPVAFHRATRPGH